MVREGFNLLPLDGEEVEAGEREVEEIRGSFEPMSQKRDMGHPEARDLRGLSWSSIDNDTSRDLDQVEWAERTQAGIRVLVGIADVAAAVGKDTVLDRAAALQTQTVYTAVHNFPMLPNELSTDLTSLNEGQDRRAIVCEFTVTGDGGLVGTALYEAWVRNGAQLAYSTVGPWLEGKARGDGRTDPKILNDAAIQAQLRLQDEAAQLLHRQRVAQGALEFNRVEADPVVIDGKVQSIKAVMRNRASDLIADLMIASNETMARMLRESGRSSIRRVVRSPERWSRIVALVAAKGTALPESPDARALNKFLVAQQASDPVHYPDLSLAIIKLMGPGEYVLAAGGSEEQPGHFGLAALDYTHSTAPNRRFADLVTQRIVKALLRGEGAPYSDEELAGIAAHCNERDAAARKVERAMQKRVAAVALGHLIGHQFTGVITGAKDKGTYIRIFDPPVEGKIVRGFEGLDVGDTATVTLSEADPVHAFIDFTRP
ncbi:Exoribonuclease II [Granulicella tundricola MP5ACTX9]|uniref:Exoribonuclease II n=2 Tax=Granulicella TaxID=940557 RepID=E8WVK7_GRATM|nr:Exoribonuclease II [Granulicella tundricola MP5ACTX9]